MHLLKAAYKGHEAELTTARSRTRVLGAGAQARTLTQRHDDDGQAHVAWRADGEVQAEVSGQ